MRLDVMQLNVMQLNVMQLNVMRLNVMRNTCPAYLILESIIAAFSEIGINIIYQLSGHLPDF